MNLRNLGSLVTIIVGGVLAIFFWGVDWQWFQMGPLGLVLIALGTYELVTHRHGRGRDQQTFTQNVRREVMEIMGNGSDRTRTKRTESDEDA